MWLRIAVLFCIVTLSMPIAAGEKANTLTKQEATEGWLLLFDGESTFGWDVDGEVAVKDGMLVVGGKKKTTMVFRTPFQHFSLRCDGKLGDKGKEKARFFLVDVNDKTNAAAFSLGVRNPPGVNKTVWGTYRFSIFREGKQSSYMPGAVYDLGNNGQAGLEGIPQKIKNLSAYALKIQVPANEKVYLKNIKLKPGNTVSLFNGKSLANWKVLPGYKSKYTVTEEGWMNVKDGRGDIQTLDTFKNFVLQLDCISNGEHLNSGIFFRCIPNQYQQGYEAQIRNQFTPGEERVYKLNKYDPKTHEKLGTYEVKSTAFDYGTGAIYRRMPARKGVAKDKEWFTLTVAAHDRHLATWVNGIPVADWTDHRPKDDNARKGYCPNPGVISIQGHDPTTDLSFRNFRISEITTPKK